MSQQATCELLVYSSSWRVWAAAGHWIDLASKAYDFRLRFWNGFLGSFLYASSSKVLCLRAALRPSFLEPQKLHGIHNVGPQSFRSLVELFCAPILVTRFASRVRVPVSESSCGPEIGLCTFRALYHEADSVSGIWACKLAENLNKKLLNGQRCLCPTPPK